LKKAFIVELFGHEMCLLSIIQSLSACNRLKIHVIVSDPVNEHLQGNKHLTSGIEWHVVKTEEPIRNRLLRNALSFRKTLGNVLRIILDHSVQGDIVFINSLESDFVRLILRNLIMVLKKRSIAILAGVHNAFLFLDDSAVVVSEAKNLKRFYREVLESRLKKKHIPSFLSYAISSMILINKRATLRKISALAAGHYVFGDQIVRPSDSHARLVFPAKPIDIEELESRSQKLRNSLKERVVFTVPGSVDSRRRNYETIIKCFEEIDFDNFDLIFLGKLVDKRVMELLSRTAIKDKIKTFDRRISEEKFEYWIRETDFVLAPLSEIPPYGKYKISGNPGDALSAGLPLIIPCGYYENALPDGTICYSSLKQLKDIVDNLLSDSEYRHSISLKAINRSFRFMQDLHENFSICRVLEELQQ